MRLRLRVWRQRSAEHAGQLVGYDVDGVEGDMSFLEMLDLLNLGLSRKGEEPVAFDHDCREGICGSCSLVIDGVPHGPRSATTACQLYMRHFRDDQAIVVEPWRAAAFPVIRDLVVDRGALDRVLQAGGYVSVKAGSAPDANTLPVARQCAERAFQAASCIGCGACVAACPNASAMLFVAAKLGQFAALPQGQPERMHRAIAMVESMDDEGFGNCGNHYECVAVCPKSIPQDFIARLNREFFHAAMTAHEFASLPEHEEHEE
ncbi:MAG: succinate dehydrogenase/fumarate reductase iron-sulfur subunit [Pseudomonadota bacterium]|nr:succinate dehydrogenase/fumarate reductase iron-sulfur subunit [Pseudomonadota bacterium]